MKNSIAVITGASSGLGKEYVKLLVKEKHIKEIWAIARNRDKLDRLKLLLGDKIRTFSIDLSHTEEIIAFQDTLRREQPDISYLINCAGFAKLCSYADISIAESVNMIDLNCGGVVAMGLACLPYMKHGSRILNISSQSSFQPLPYLNLYSATKAFVRNYSRALGVELRGRGISVTAVCPGWMDTALFERASIGAKKAPRYFCGMVSPDKVARKSLFDAKRGKDVSVYSLYVKSCHALAKVAPQRVMMRLWLMQQGL